MKSFRQWLQESAGIVGGGDNNGLLYQANAGIHSKYVDNSDIHRYKGLSRGLSPECKYMRKCRKHRTETGL